MTSLPIRGGAVVVATLRILSILYLARLAGDAVADTQPSATAPLFAPGDCWYYSTWESPSLSGTVLHRREWVRRVTPEGEVEVTLGPADRAVRILLDRNGNYVRRFSYSFEPSQADLRFPLVVGGTWHTAYSTLLSDSSLPSHTEADYKVIGYGTVHVPAGDFDAFEVRSVGSMRFEDSKYPGTIITTTWYAPTVRRMVKRDIDYHDGRSRLGYHQELMSFGHLELASEPLTPAAASESDAAHGDAASGTLSAATSGRFVGHC
jgi:hypothetical protein